MQLALSPAPSPTAAAKSGTAAGFGVGSDGANGSQGVPDLQSHDVAAPDQTSAIAPVDSFSALLANADASPKVGPAKVVTAASVAKQGDKAAPTAASAKLSAMGMVAQLQTGAPPPADAQTGTAWAAKPGDPVPPGGKNAAAGDNRSLPASAPSSSSDAVQAALPAIFASAAGTAAPSPLQLASAAGTAAPSPLQTSGPQGGAAQTDPNPTVPIPVVAQELQFDRPAHSMAPSSSSVAPSSTDAPPAGWATRAPTTADAPSQTQTLVSSGASDSATAQTPTMAETAAALLKAQAPNIEPGAAIPSAAAAPAVAEAAASAQSPTQTAPLAAQAKPAGALSKLAAGKIGGPGAAAALSPSLGAARTASAPAASTDDNGAPASDPAAQGAPNSGGGTPAPAGDAYSQAASDAAAAAVQNQQPGQTAALPAQVRPQTVTRLAAQIAQTAQGPASQFSLTLHPAELGGVQVKVQVDRNGGVSAILTFDNPQAAADLGARSDDLKAALNQAGFSVSDNGLSFNLSGQGQFGAGQGQTNPSPWGGRSFRAAAAGAEDLLAAVNEAASRLKTSPALSGLDIRI